MRQTEGQQTKHFVQKLIRRYNALYGDLDPADQISTGTASGSTSPSPASPSPASARLREDILLKVFVTGLLPKIKKGMYARLPSDYTFDQATAAAIVAEDLMIDEELNEAPTVNAISGENLELISKQQKRLEELESTLKTLQLSQAAPVNHSSPEVNNISYQQRGRGRPRGRGTGRGNRSYQGNSNRGQNFSQNGYQGQNFSGQNTRPAHNSFPQQHAQGPALLPHPSVSQNQNFSSGRQSAPPTTQNGNRQQGPGRQLICFYCNKPNHYARECKSRIRDERQANRQ
jgi:hypothetical protein